MRVLIDSTVWIDFFRGRETAQTLKLEQCLQNRDDVCCCGFVLTEVLQGIRDEKEFVSTKLHFEGLIYLQEDRTLLNWARPFTVNCDARASRLETPLTV